MKDHRFNLYRIPPDGGPDWIASVETEGRGFLVKPVGGSAHCRWLLGSAGDGRFDGLPYYLDDLRPQGFLGRAVARGLAGKGYPGDPRDWSDRVILDYLLHDADDLPGNLIAGDAALERYLKAPAPERVSPKDFPALAERAMSDGWPGSSVGGEQPKFTAYTDQGHVIVKFAPTGRTQVARRWRALLAAEHIAQGVLAEAGVPAARTALRQAGGRLFLESQRFDRAGERGRLSAVSLAAVDAEYVGTGSNWVSTAVELHALGVLDSKSLNAIRTAHLFGELIGNTDMHQGNLALRAGNGAAWFEAAPIYDMLPMGLAPTRGEMPKPGRPKTGVILEDGGEAWRAVANGAAREFWIRAAQDRIAGELVGTARVGPGGPG